MMHDSLSALAGMLGRCQAGIAAILQQAGALPQWADGLADLLLPLLPQASLTACLLSGEGVICLAVRPQGEYADPSQKRLLQSQLSFLDPVASGVQKLPADALPGLQLLAAAIHENERPRGFLVVGLPREAAGEDVEQAGTLLAVAAPALALRWRLESLQRERAELARFALVGQAFAGLAHDLNNALNSMMLQTSVVQLRVEPQIRQELAAIRQHGAQAAGLVRLLQHVVQERREKSYDVDLDSVLAEVLEEETKLRCRLSWEAEQRRSLPPSGETLSASAPRIHSTRSAVKQFLRLLLEGVCADTKATVKVTTTAADDGVVLSLAIADGPADAGTEDNPPAAEALLWQNLDEVGRQAGRSLLRQLGGTVRVERGQDDALLVRIVWQQSA